MSAVFVTGTGTDIGKTFVTAGLIRHFRATGRAVAALKPVATGFDPATAADSDPGILLAALGRPVEPAEIERIAPWRYAAPVAPDLAAKREGRRLDVTRLISFCQEAIAAFPGLLLIEGIGGIMVPLDEKRLVLDWMKALGIPIVLVTGTYVGTLSHTLTALDVLTRHGLTPRVVVINETPGSAVTSHSTLESLLNFTRGVSIATLRHAPEGAVPAPDGAFATIAELLEQMPGR